MNKPVESLPSLNYVIIHNKQNINLIAEKLSYKEIIQLENILRSRSTDNGIMNLLAGI